MKTKSLQKKFKTVPEMDRYLETHDLSTAFAQETRVQPPIKKMGIIYLTPLEVSSISLSNVD